jgi:predicted transcriptional regulator
MVNSKHTAPHVTLMDEIDRLQEDVKNNMVEKVLSVLRRLGGKAQHTKLLHDSKIKAKEFNEIIDTLLEAEAIEITIKEGKTHYKIIENPMNLTNPHISNSLIEM